MRHINIALGDLRHGTIGRHSVFMPIGIGQIASYSLSRIGRENINIKLYDDPDVIIKDIALFKPDIVGLSNYCWNSELTSLVFRYAKKINPLAACVAGGPEFPIDETECREYLSMRPEIDFYVYFEGELAFCELVKKIADEEELERLKSRPVSGVMSIHPKKRGLVFGKPFPRFKNLDEIPPAYSTRLMDQWFDGRHAPSIETSRGCPFSCGYCFAGHERFTPVAFFGVQRIKDELTYLARKMRKYPNILLSICDSNFGMYKRDEEIARHCKELQDRYGWPNAFDVTTGKANYGRILKIASILKNKMSITSSLQTLNPGTLEVIKRRNPPMDEYREIQRRIKTRGMRSIAELIAPMPEETKDSFFEGMKTVLDAGVEDVVPYTTMLLKGTHLASGECRKKYRMQTRFRIVPRQFGQYAGKKCFEIEEVCVATSTISFEEYLQIRGAAFVYLVFSTKQFDVIHRHLAELKINRYEYCNRLWEMIKSGKTALSPVYAGYIHETKKELWPSRKAVYDYFKKPGNYSKLLKSRIGDNLIRKYSTELLLRACIPAIELAYSVIKDMATGLDKEKLESLDAAKYWISKVRNIGNVSNVYKRPSSLNATAVIDAGYDLLEWYRSGKRPLASYRGPVRYKIYYDRRKLGPILSQARDLYGSDAFFAIGKQLINWNIENFWCRCEHQKAK